MGNRKRLEEINKEIQHIRNITHSYYDETMELEEEKKALKLKILNDEGLLNDMNWFFYSLNDYDLTISTESIPSDSPFWDIFDWHDSGYSLKGDGAVRLWFDDGVVYISFHTNDVDEDDIQEILERYNIEFDTDEIYKQRERYVNTLKAIDEVLGKIE